jgi:hypothetical protein
MLSAGRILKMFTLLNKPCFIRISKTRDIYERDGTGCEYVECSIDTNTKKNNEEAKRVIVFVNNYTCPLDAKQMTPAARCGQYGYPWCQIL